MLPLGQRRSNDEGTEPLAARIVMMSSKKGSTAKGVKNATSTCNTLTTTLGAYTAPDFKIEVRYVANATGNNATYGAGTTGSAAARSASTSRASTGPASTGPN